MGLIKEKQQFEALMEPTSAELFEREVFYVNLKFLGTRVEGP